MTTGDVSEGGNVQDCMTVPVPAGVIHVITADTIRELLAMNQLQSLLDNERPVATLYLQRVHRQSQPRFRKASSSRSQIL